MRSAGVACAGTRDEGAFVCLLASGLAAGVPCSPPPTIAASATPASTSAPSATRRAGAATRTRRLEGDRRGNDVIRRGGRDRRRRALMSSFGRLALPGMPAAAGCAELLWVISAGVWEPRRSKYVGCRVTLVEGRCGLARGGGRLGLELLEERVRRRGFVCLRAVPVEREGSGSRARRCRLRPGRRISCSQGAGAPHR